MGWASEAFHRDVMKAGMSSGLIATGGMTCYQGNSLNNKVTYEKEEKFDSDQFINEMECELPFDNKPKNREHKKDVKVDESNNISVSAKKIFDSNSEYSRGIYNVDIGGFLTIRSVKLYCNSNTGELYITMPSKKTNSNRYMNYIDVRSDLYSVILKACMDENEKNIKFIQD